MKLLKETTKARYSNTQLLKHLDRLSDFIAQYNYSKGIAPMRIDWAYSKVFTFDYDNDCYVFECSTLNRDRVLQLIDRYSTHVRFIKTHNMPKTKN